MQDRSRKFSRSLGCQLAAVIACVFGGYFAGLALVLAVDMFGSGRCALASSTGLLALVALAL